MSGFNPFGYRSRYFFVFKKEDEYIAIEDYGYNNNGNVDFEGFYTQGWQPFDKYLNPYQNSQSLQANDHASAVLKASQILSEEINRLRIEVNKLKDDKSFSFKEADAYKLFGVEENAPIKDVKKVHTDLSKYINMDNGKVKSLYLIQIINAAWNALKNKD